MWKSKILFLWGVCAYECLTFRRFGANLKKVDTHKHEEKESTSADTLQRDFQLHSCSLLRGNEEGRMEDGFGVAGANRACGQALTGPPVIAENVHAFTEVGIARCR